MADPARATPQASVITFDGEDEVGAEVLKDYPHPVLVELTPDGIEVSTLKEEA